MTVRIGQIEIGNTLPFALISGPCQLESLDHARQIAGSLAETCAGLGIPFIFKASYDKANRTSLKGARGPGLAAGLEILAQIRAEFGCPVLTDVHSVEDCAPVAEICDVLQIPAFLCRQTDLLLAAAATGRAIQIKKGQFLAPWDMGHVAAKVADQGNTRILLCERGTCFGYNALVSDFRALPIMAGFGYPVIFDATHSVQQPGGQGQSTGGQREFVAPLARAALAVGCAGLFIETHQTPETAPSDGPNMVPLAQMPALLAQLQRFDRLAKSDSLP
ncbi:MAG: 3-deoxy-8-phosphooctulonate synthase [Roseinatronobacter sp.]|nr:3-deoxy-8-phosphooctulonate synthase [Roseinatronobacter sp.]